MISIKKIILLTITTLCILGGNISVFAQNTTNTNAAPPETVIVNDDTYIICSKTKGKNVNKNDKIIVNGNTYFCESKSLNAEDLFIIIFFTIAMTGIIGWYWANTSTNETRSVELFAEYGIGIAIFGSIVLFISMLFWE